MSKIPFSTAKKLGQQICEMCEGILGRAGPFLKEGIYQDLLIHELTLNGFIVNRERVFNCTFLDSEGNKVNIGNNQCMRSDIELVELNAILELKSSSAPTRDDDIWQLKNYLEQRPECGWGIVINFISKFSAMSSPKVQCNLLYKQTTDSSNGIAVHQWNGIEKQYLITKYYTELFETKSYPSKNDIFKECVTANQASSTINITTPTDT